MHFSTSTVLAVPFFVATAIWTTHGTAQERPAETTLVAASSEDAISAQDLLGQLDLDAPTDPLLALLGASPEAVMTPKTGRDFAFSIIPQALDSFGNETFSFGITVNPGMLMIGDGAGVEELHFGGDLETARKLSWVNLSVAAVRTSGDAAFTQYSLGASIIYDKKSPLVNYAGFAGCLQRAGSIVNASEILNKTTIDALDNANVSPEAYIKLRDELVELATAPKFDEAEARKLLKQAGVNESGINAAIDKIKEARARVLEDGNIFADWTQASLACRVKETKWNREVYALGVAGYYTDIEAGGSTNGYGIWASAAYPLGESAQGIISGRFYDNLVRSRKVDGEATNETVDGWSLGGRLVYQLAKAQRSGARLGAGTRGFVEAAYTEESFSGINDKFWQAGIGAEIAVGNGTFLQFIVGDTFDSKIERSPYLSAQFKWSLTTAAR